MTAVNLVDQVIAHAIECGASDIHAHCSPEGLTIKLRIDGLLIDDRIISRDQQDQVVARIKVLAAMNSAERRIPQDGMFRVTHTDRVIDIRVSTFPAVLGEKVVLRILDRAQQPLSLDALGMSDTLKQQFTELIYRPYGFVLVTGPTGSGKTTTLYAALTRIATPEKNIITLEDPVEYQLHDAVQGQINPDAGFTFERGIRAILRQDPDIALIGEIRDRETARIAIEAALTGHIVLSTVHTNDAPGALMRLMDMGIEPFLINAALSGIVAQRLVRKNCTLCTVYEKPTVEEQRVLERLQFKVECVGKGVGCPACGQSGMRGRIGIFELVRMTNALRAHIVQHPTFDTIVHQAVTDGMVPLLHDGLLKVQSGVISLTELLRAVTI